MIPAATVRWWAVLAALAQLAVGCTARPHGWGRVRILASRLEPSSWTVWVDDQGRGADLIVDGSVRPARCRRTGRGLWCWVSGLRAGYHDLAVQVGGRGVSRRSGLSGPIALQDQTLLWVVIDRFADGDPGNNIGVRRADPAGPWGGDLVGLRRHLRFVRKLGVTALLLSPVWDHVRRGRDRDGLPALLARHPRDPLRLSPAFGAPSDLMRLLRSARRAGLRVLLDLPRGAMPLRRYGEVVRTWLSRTAADGARVGPVLAAEAREWRGIVSGLERDFAPLWLIQRVGLGLGRVVAERLAGLPAGVRSFERATAPFWKRWLGCGAAGAPAPWQRGPGSAPAARLLSTPASPGPVHRCRGASRASAAAGGVPLASRGARGALLLTAHLLGAEIPVVLYADLNPSPAQGPWPPVLRWRGLARSPRVRLLTRLFRLRRRLAVLRGGTARVTARGDLLLIYRRHRRCQALAVFHRGPRRRRLAVSLAELGWQFGAAGTSFELVDRLAGEGVSVRDGQVVLALPPFGAALLVPAEPGVCRG